MTAQLELIPHPVSRVVPFVGSATHILFDYEYGGLWHRVTLHVNGCLWVWVGEPGDFYAPMGRLLDIWEVPAGSDAETCAELIATGQARHEWSAAWLTPSAAPAGRGGARGTTQA